LVPSGSVDTVSAMALVTFEEFGPVAVITLNRPEARNAINPPLAEAIGDAIDRLENSTDLKVGVLAAAVTEPRPVFCAGNDLRSIDGEPATTPRGGFAGLIDYPRTKPLVAAVDGLATSGGCEIVLACDLVVASSRSSFAVAEIKWNLSPLAGGVIRLPRLLGRATAMDMILTGRAVDAAEALTMGLANRVVPKGKAKKAAQDLAHQIARFPQICMTEDRLSVYEQFALNYPDAMANEIRISGYLPCL